jgi:hypothetical protein
MCHLSDLRQADWESSITISTVVRVRTGRKPVLGGNWSGLSSSIRYWEEPERLAPPVRRLGPYTRVGPSHPSRGPTERSRKAVPIGSRVLGAQKARPEQPERPVGSSEETGACWW